MRITGNDRLLHMMLLLYPSRGSVVCEWTRVMISARSAALPSVVHDRLRAAAEFRRMLRAGRA